MEPDEIDILLTLAMLILLFKSFNKESSKPYSYIYLHVHVTINSITNCICTGYNQ